MRSLDRTTLVSDLRIMGYIVVIELILLMITFLTGVISQNPFWPFLVAGLLGPLAFITSATYSTKKRRSVIKKARIFSEMINEAAESLRSRDYAKFDLTLIVESELISSGTVVPFLSAAQRFLMNAKFLILYDSRGRAKKLSNIERISDCMIFAASSIGRQDQRAAYQNIGKIFLYAISASFNKLKSKRKHTMFIEDCVNLSELLQVRDFPKANKLLQGMLVRLGSQLPSNKDLIGLSWQSLILLWISARFLVFEGRQLRKGRTLLDRLETRLLVGPSRLLSLQIVRVIDCYEASDWAGVAEQITDSFDARAVIFRNLVDIAFGPSGNQI